MARITELCADGFGEVEIHLHHRDDTEKSLRRKFQDAVAAYRQHGALSAWPDGRHGDLYTVTGRWRIRASKTDGTTAESTMRSRCCRQRMYADFTFPPGSSSAQPRQVNSIYYARSSAQRPKSHEWGQPARAGKSGKDGLLLVPGPPVPYLRRGRPGWRIAMDDSDLAGYRTYNPARLDRWVRAGVHVSVPACVFVSLHCHGADDRNRETLLGNDLNALFTDAEARYNDGKRYRLHYVTARETFNIVKAIEAGVEDAAGARNWLLPPPAAFRHEP